MNYHFIMQELVKEFEVEFHCLGEDTEKCKTFSSNNKRSSKD